MPAQQTKNLDYFYKALTSGQVEIMSGGKIPKMSHEQASGLIGSWIVETGKPGLEGLDVVERGNNNAGRGLSQYTGVRRGPYDAAREKALATGQDVHGAEFQLKYFVDEYIGRHDPGPGKSLIGWTRVFENAPKQGTAAQYADYYTGSAAEGRGYFRPGIPHTDRRVKAALAVSEIYRAQRAVQSPASTVQPSPGSQPSMVPTTALTAPPPLPPLRALQIPTLNQF